MENSKKKLYWMVEEDGNCSHVEPVYLYPPEKGEPMHFGFHETFSNAKKELVESQVRRFEDARDALGFARAARKDHTLDMWGESARNRAGIK